MRDTGARAAGKKGVESADPTKGGVDTRSIHTKPTDLIMHDNVLLVNGEQRGPIGSLGHHDGLLGRVEFMERQTQTLVTNVHEGHAQISCQTQATDMSLTCAVM